MRVFNFLFISILLMTMISCRKDPSSPKATYPIGNRIAFTGEWNFLMRHMFNGFIYDEEVGDYVYQISMDTIWEKEGTIKADLNSADGLIINYGINEKDFMVSTFNGDVTCLADCQHAGYDTLGPYANWWYLAEGDFQNNKSVIYNLGVNEAYGSPNSWQIIGFPK